RPTASRGTSWPPRRPRGRRSRPPSATARRVRIRLNAPILRAAGEALGGCGGIKTAIDDDGRPNRLDVVSDGAFAGTLTTASTNSGDDPFNATADGAGCKGTATINAGGARDPERLGLGTVGSGDLARGHPGRRDAARLH